MPKATSAARKKPAAAAAPAPDKRKKSLNATTLRAAPPPPPVQPDAEAPAQWVALDDLVPWAANPKPHEDVSHIVDSIQRFGFGDPLVARLANREVLAGHGRLKAARVLKLAMVPVRFLELSERDAHLYALAANRLSEKSPYDETQLLHVLNDYSLEEVALAGWSEKDLEKMGGSIDDGGDGEAEDQSGKAHTDFAVLIECSDEQEQLHVIQQCEELGLKCRALV